MRKKGNKNQFKKFIFLLLGLFLLTGVTEQWFTYTGIRDSISLWKYSNEFVLSAKGKLKAKNKIKIKRGGGSYERES